MRVRERVARARSRSRKDSIMQIGAINSGQTTTTTATNQFIDHKASSAGSASALRAITCCAVCLPVGMRTVRQSDADIAAQSRARGRRDEASQVESIRDVCCLRRRLQVGIIAGGKLSRAEWPKSGGRKRIGAPDNKSDRMTLERRN